MMIDSLTVSDSAVVRFGVSPYGVQLSYDFAATAAHALVTGITRSGKSSLLYSMLAQLSAYPFVRVIGSDISSLLLTPFQTRGEQLIALGGDVGAHVRVFEQAVALMESRLSALVGEGLNDKLSEFSVSRPLVVVVVEELIMLMQLAKASDALSSPKGKSEALIKSLLLRLLAGSAKCGMRLVLSLQRPDADFIGGAARSQLETRFLLRSDGEGIRMAMSELDDRQRAKLMAAAPGVGYYAAPGLHPTLFRSHQMDYARYRQLVKPPVA